MPPTTATFTAINTNNQKAQRWSLLVLFDFPVQLTHVKGGVNLDHFGGAKVDQLVKG